LWILTQSGHRCFALASRTAVSTGSFSMTCMTAKTLAVAPPADNSMSLLA
jgi:hypothetical protein